jgi:hypothetical protein
LHAQRAQGLARRGAAPRRARARCALWGEAALRREAGYLSWAWDGDARSGPQMLGPNCRDCDASCKGPKARHGPGGGRGASRPHWSTGRPRMEGRPRDSPGAARAAQPLSRPGRPPPRPPTRRRRRPLPQRPSLRLSTAAMRASAPKVMWSQPRTSDTRPVGAPPAQPGSRCAAVARHSTVAKAQDSSTWIESWGGWVRGGSGVWCVACGGGVQVWC